MKTIAITQGSCTSYTSYNHYTNDLHKANNERYIIEVTDEKYEELCERKKKKDFICYIFKAKGGTFAIRLFTSQYYKTQGETILKVLKPDTKPTTTEPFTSYRLSVDDFRLATFEEEYIFRNEFGKAYEVKVG